MTAFSFETAFGTASQNDNHALAYEGAPIATRDEFISLTDMWRAAGGDDDKRPAEWLRHDATKTFVSYLSDTFNVGNTHIELIQTLRGGANPGTWAHWQIALAYAKYLSPAFHVWCNNVVRAHFEGRGNEDDVPDVEVKNDDPVNLRIVIEGRQIFGKKAAAQLWKKLNLPIVPEMKFANDEPDLFSHSETIVRIEQRRAA